MVMIMVNIAEAKAKLSEFIDAVGRGEAVVICRHNRPVVELRSVEAPRLGKRDLSPMFPGEAFLTEAFFEPMTEAELREWEGPGETSARVAERPSAYRPSRSSRRKHR
jgi:prevent-host-death family protein